VTDPPACARCGRGARLSGRAPEGWICGNCVAIRNSATCAQCGEHRRVASRDPDGLAWCARCQQRHHHADVDAERRQRIIAAVTAVDPSVSVAVVEAVLDATVAARVSLRRLAEHLDAQPAVFAVGPTSTLAVLDRFTIALEAAGAARITTIDPLCGRYGSRRRWHARVGDGGEGGTCCARTHREVCAVCARARWVDHRDGQGRPVCAPCVQQQRRHQRLDELATEIIDLVQRDDPGVAAIHIIGALDQLAPKVPTRAVIARQLRRGPPRSVSVHGLPLVARLADALRAAGAVVPAACCEDCGGPAEPLVVYRDLVWCLACAKRCPSCDGDTKNPPSRGVADATAGHAGPAATVAASTSHSTPTTGAGGVGNGPSDAAQPAANRRRAPGSRHAGCASVAPSLSTSTTTSALPTRWSSRWVALRAAILAADNPTQVRKWVRHSSAGHVLGRLATGETALSHAAPDAHGTDRSAMHLRALLVAVEALPAEDRSINRLEDFAAGLLEHVDDAGDRKVVRAWLHGQVLPASAPATKPACRWRTAPTTPAAPSAKAPHFSAAWGCTAGPFTGAPKPTSTAGSAEPVPPAGWPGRSWCGPPPVPTCPAEPASRPVRPERCAPSSTARSAGPSPATS
jgi:hypothetical protein